MKPKYRRVLTLIVMVSLICGTSPTPGLSQEPEPPLPPEVQSPTTPDISKVHGELQRAVRRVDPSDEIFVVLRILPGADIQEYFAGPVLIRPFVDPLGLQVAVGQVRAANIYKLASVPGVVFMQKAESIVEPPQPPEPDLAFSPSRKALREKAAAMAARAGESPSLVPASPSGERIGEELAGAEPESPGTGADPTGWYDAAEGHKSAAAWEKGFTGAGVKVMANDSGIDFAHPDLQGTQARVTDSSSPYFGWPEQFDSYSMYLYVLDNYFGTTYVAAGMADYADTSATCILGSCSYQPIGADEAHDYTLPATSASGTYHIGSHPDKTLEFWWGFGERAAVLVVDETSAGVYETVYVDLNFNLDFSDDKPLRRGDEISYLDWTGDGVADISGGMIYFIADGLNSIPACDWLWGGFLCPPPSNGDLVAFILNDPTEAAADHGQLVASAIAGQGAVDHPDVEGAYPTWKPEGVGLVQGGGKDAKLVANGNFYLTPFLEDAFLFSAYGYDGLAGTEDDIQIVSNSYGFSSVDYDGWDGDSRLIDYIQRYVNPTVSVLFSTGNGAPGYGTITPPSPPAGIGVGASTQYGSTGTFDSIMDLDQINYGDVMTWSNRGPSALGGPGVDVVANGAWGAGSLSLNEVGDGVSAWTSWGGTSRSAPVAAGNLALIYQAYRETYAIWPGYETARALLKSGASDVNYDPVSQGAGLLNADRSTDLAAGLGGAYILPDKWRAGDYRGQEYAGFAHILYPGASDSQIFTVTNPGPSSVNLSLTAAQLTRIGRQEFDFKSMNQSLEENSFTKPDYLWDITDMIPPNTDLVEVKVIFPFEQFDNDGDYVFDSRWRVLLYDWKDQNGDGNLWTDTNGDGVVNDVEIDPGEYIRFTYGYSTGTSIQARVHDPSDRIHDGLFLGLRHRDASKDIPRTDLRFQLNFFSRSDWNMVSLRTESLEVPAGDSATFEATATVPDDQPPGFYQGFVLVDDPGGDGRSAHRSVIPVAINVAGGVFEGEDAPYPGGVRVDAINFTLGADEADTPYDNTRVSGYQDWTWRAESGDWRFFFVDEPNLSEGMQRYNFKKNILIDLEWPPPADPYRTMNTDIDVLVFGPSEDDYSFLEPDYYGPYALVPLGGSPNTNIGAGVWRFNTGSGKSSETITAAWTPGLNLIALHNVVFNGRTFEAPVSGNVGSLAVWPHELNAVSRWPYWYFNRQSVLIWASIPLNGLWAEGYGLGKPETFADQTVNQDDPDLPETASYTRTITMQHGALLEVSTGNSSGNDLDLYLLFDANRDGVFDWDREVIGSSTTPTDEESVSVKFPKDGDYMIAVHGWSVPTGSATFDLTIDGVQGYRLKVYPRRRREEIRAGHTTYLFVQWDTQGLSPGEYQGILLFGPQDAPGAASLDVTGTVR
jgi:hypothetical protein